MFHVEQMAATKKCSTWNKDIKGIDSFMKHIKSREYALDKRVNGDFKIGSKNLVKISLIVRW